MCVCICICVHVCVYMCVCVLSFKNLLQWCIEVELDFIHTILQHIYLFICCQTLCPIYILLSACLYVVL